MNVGLLNDHLIHNLPAGRQVQHLSFNITTSANKYIPKPPPRANESPIWKLPSHPSKSPENTAFQKIFPALKPFKTKARIWRLSHTQCQLNLSTCRASISPRGKVFGRFPFNHRSATPFKNQALKIALHKRIFPPPQPPHSFVYADLHPK